MIDQKAAVKVLACLLLGLLGFLGNWLKLELFFNVDFLTGSVFVILAILMLGSVYGVIAGVIAATCTYFLWHHPWAIVIMTGEALFVAWMYARRKGNVVVYDMLYWALIGMPLVYLFYHHVMAIQMQSTLLIMFKQAANGIFNSLIALILYLLSTQWRSPQKERLPYSQLIFTMMVSLVLVTALLFLITGMRLYLDKEKQTLAAQTSYIAEDVQGDLASWIKERHLVVQTLAAVVGDPNTANFADMQRQVETLKAVIPGFAKLGVVNQDGIAVAFAPLEVDGKPTLGVNFSDRSYVSIMKDKQPYITDVLMGKLGNPAAIALLLAPIVLHGEYRGYAGGVVDLKEILAIFKKIQGHSNSNSNLTLVDGNWRVIASSLPDQKTMAPFVRPYNRGRVIPLSETFHWIPESQPGTSIMQRWVNSLMVRALPLSPEFGWKIIVEEPIYPIVQKISRFSIYRLGLLGLLLIIAVTISHFFSNGLTSTLTSLQQITTLLPQRIAAAGAIAWPNSKVRELQGLSDNFQKMADSLQEREEALEERVASRTEDLQDTVSRLAEEMTERRQAEETLRLTRENLELALRGGDLGTWDWDIKKDIVNRDERWLQMLGYQVDEIEPNVRGFERLIHPEDASAALQNLNAHMQEKTPFFEFEYRLRHKSGAWVWVLGKGKVVERDEQGQPVRACGTHQNITGRKQAEARLRESEEKYRGIFDESVTTIYLFDHDKNFIDANQAGLDLLGYSREELLNLSIPDVDADPVVVLPAHQELLSGGRLISYEHKLRRKDGTIITVLNNSRPLTDSQGNIVGMLSTLIDITERKQAEQALADETLRRRILVEQSRDGIVVLDVNGKVYEANQRYARMLGYSDEEVSQLYAWDWDVQWTQDELQEQLRRVDTAGAKLETRHRRKDGTLINVEISTNGVMVGGQKLVFCVCRDITERKRAEAEIIRQREELRGLAMRLADVEESERKKLAGEVHDDVCQNLASIGIKLEILKATAAHEPLGKWLSRLADASTLIEQTGGIARKIMEGLRPSVLDNYGLPGGLQQIADQFSQRTGIELEFQESEPGVRFKPEVELALFRIAQEALHNVAKHARASHVVVTEKVDQDTVRLIIADNGVGFDPESMAAPNEGHGWGLITINERAKAVGGTCRIESQPGHGSRVVVEVPR